MPCAFKPSSLDKNSNSGLMQCEKRKVEIKKIKKSGMKS